MSLEVVLDPGLRGRVRLGVVTLEDVRVEAQSAALLAEIEEYGRSMRERHPGDRSAEVPGVSAARDLYKALGIDPTRTRPSNEALLRRVLKGEALYRVNTLVDALNLASLRAQLPFGLYDLAHVRPPVVLRLGHPGEEYEGIRKGPVHVAGRPVLVDAGGAFGNPTSDSARTCIRLETTRALVTVYAPAVMTETRLLAVLDESAGLLTRTCGGSVGARHVVS
jgi:DNA/RNA-binding domain of Phe-tRNA-synthetase-like protein